MQLTGMLYGSQLLKYVDFPAAEVLGPEATEEFTAKHPRLEDVVAADQSAEGKTESLPGDEELAAEAAAFAAEADEEN